MSNNQDNKYKITEWIVKHNDELLKDIEVLSTDAKTNPILKTYYKEALLDEIRQHVAKALSLSYEEVANTVDEDFIHKYTKE